MSEELKCKKCQKPLRQTGGGFSPRLIDVCICETPQPSVDSGDVLKQSAFSGFEEEEESTELELTEEEFPVERFMALSVLGRGAAGTVYLCRDRLLGKRVAVKTLHELTRGQLVSFHEEARATSKLSHPNIIDVLDFGATESGVPYMVMEYFPGTGIERHLEIAGSMSVATARTVIEQVCDALDYAHGKKVFHRDLKPTNILMLEKSKGAIEVRLIDFGMAKVKEATGSVTEYQNKTLAGTPSYMAPDPVFGFEYDERSEVYSLGCVLFEMLAGVPPYVGESAMQTISLHVNAPVPRISDFADVDSRAELVLVRSLAKQPAERFQSVRELKEALCSREAIDEEGHEPGAPAKRLNRSLSAVASVVLLLGLLSIVLIVLGHTEEEKPIEDGSARQAKRIPDEAKIGVWKTNDETVDTVTDAVFSKPSITQKPSGILRVRNGTSKELEELEKYKPERLRLSSGQYSGEDLYLLTRLPLRSLWLQLSNSEDEDYRFLNKMNTLTELTIAIPFKSTGDCLRFIDGRKITKLALVGDFGDDVLRKVPSLPALELLSILNNSTISGAGMRVESYPALRRLRLEDSMFNNLGFRLLSKLPKLSVIELIDSPRLPGLTISASGRISAYERLAKYPRDTFKCLKSCNLDGLLVESARLTDDHYTDLSRLDSVHWLHLPCAYGNGSKPSVVNFAKITRLKNLRSLHLTGEWISFEYLNVLHNARSLRRLTLKETKLSNDELAGVARLPLEQLSLESSNVTKAGFHHFAEMRSLVRLHLSGEQLNPSDMKTLARMLPDCEINRGVVE